MLPTNPSDARAFPFPPAETGSVAAAFRRGNEPRTIIIPHVTWSMSRRVKLSEVHSVFDGLTYPVTSEAAREATDDVVLVMADGEERLADVVARSEEREFVCADDLGSEVYMHLPIAAVGEPGQSEGTA